MATNLLSPIRPRGFRRVSSESVTVAELKIKSPTLVLPPNQLSNATDAHEVAAAMELARHELEDNDATPSETPPETSVTDKYAFAFDIDGVLIRGGRPIPEAIEAMKVLNGQNEYGIKVYVANLSHTP